MNTVTQITARYDSEPLTFDVLHTKYNDLLLRMAYMSCGNPDLAKDIVQETWIRAWRYLDSLRSIAAARSWLITIMKREHARMYARKQLDIVALEDCENLVECDDKVDKQLELRDVLKQLHGKDKEVLMMDAVEGLKHDEIAQRMGVTRNAVAIRLYRARQKARKLNG